MQCKAFHPRFEETGLVGLLILILNFCRNRPAFAKTVNPQFKTQKIDSLNVNYLAYKKESS